MTEFGFLGINFESSEFHIKIIGKNSKNVQDQGS
jgi:hypothetical protein